MYFSGSVAVPSRHSSNSSMARDVAVPSSLRSESMLPMISPLRTGYPLRTSVCDRLRYIDV